MPFNDPEFEAPFTVVDSSGNPILTIGTDGKVTTYGSDGAQYVVMDSAGLKVSSVSTVPPVGYVLIERDTAGPSNVNIVMLPGGFAGVDPANILVHAGTDQVDTLMLQSPNHFGKADARIKLASDDALSTGSSVTLDAATTVVNNALSIFGETKTSGEIKSTIGGITETWHLITPLNAWTNVAGNVQFAYRKVSSPANTVEVIGLLQAGNRNDGIILGNLPVGYRPVNTQWFPISINAVPPVGGNSPHVSVDSAGDIKVWGVNTAAMSFLGLDTCSVKTDR